MALRLTSCLSMCIVCAAPASAADYSAPQFSMSHTGSQTGFTDSTLVRVKITFPEKTASGTLWCITEDSTLDSCDWGSEPYEVTLSSGNGLKTVYMAYKYGATVSALGQSQITLDQTAPAVTLLAPAGLPGALTGGEKQAIGINPQFITASVIDAVATDPITVSLNACNKEEVCSAIATESGTPPFVWPWPMTSANSDTTYIQITATNAAGKTRSTEVPAGAAAFSVFPPASLTSPVMCSATLCPTLAGPASNAQHIQGDPPSPEVDGDTFTGYADPSMRRDPAISSINPNGTNLWMLYSHPETQVNTTYATTTNMVEIHLASSLDGGNTWKAWCNPSPTSCTGETPIWPSYHWEAKGKQPEQYSSHEVANFWPYSSDNVNWKWYAVHLMYFVPAGETIPWGVGNTGCLVTSVATTPYGLANGWSAEERPPSSCTAAMPAGNAAVSYTELTNLAGSHAPKGIACLWGEPAILVQNGVAYLATECFESVSLQGFGYYIFANALDSSGGLSGPWSYYRGPFYAPGVQFYTPDASFVTEMDWALRSDGTSLVAVVSPASIADHYETQYGCVALEFSLSTGFGDLIAAVGDEDSLETQGPNACTYEPTSNTGIVLVRRQLSGSNYLALTMVETGLMP